MQKAFNVVFQTKIPVQIHFIYCSHPNDDFPVNRCVLVSSTTTSKTLIDGMMLDDSDAKWQIIYIRIALAIEDNHIEYEPNDRDEITNKQTKNTERYKL